MEPTRQSLIGRVKKLKAEIEQIFIDAAHWNENVRSADESPIDPDPDGQLKKILDGINRTLEKEEIRTP